MISILNINTRILHFVSTQKTQPIREALTLSKFTIRKGMQCRACWIHKKYKNCFGPTTIAIKVMIDFLFFYYVFIYIQKDNYIMEATPNSKILQRIK